MRGFHYQNGQLMVEDIAIADIAAHTPTPFYCYSRAALQDNYTQLKTAFAQAGLSDTQICYSLKANGNLAIINTLAQMGAGADIVSAGELIRARAGGIAADKIVFSGVGKTASEIRAALEAGIARFNVESLSEIDLLAAIARDMNTIAHVAVRINPDIGAGGHAKISTGKMEDKFGIAWDEAEKAYAHIATLDALKADGIDMHIGSQITELAPFRAAFERLADLLARLRAAGHHIEHLDLGGGLGVAYAPDSTALDITAYAALVAEILGASGCKIILEPGRFIAANAGVLITRIIRSKMGAARNFIIVDAAMTELLRPTLYDAYHAIAPVVASRAPTHIWDVVGAVCESGDFLGLDRTLPELQTDDLLAIFNAGAYAAVLASDYNARRRAAEIMVHKAVYHPVRARATYDDMLAAETIPDWA